MGSRFRWASQNYPLTNCELPCKRHELGSVGLAVGLVHYILTRQAPRSLRAQFARLGNMFVVFAFPCLPHVSSCPVQVRGLVPSPPPRRAAAPPSAATSIADPPSSAHGLTASSGAGSAARARSMSRITCSAAGALLSSSSSEHTRRRAPLQQWWCLLDAFN